MSGPAHDPIETRWRMSGAQAGEEFANWREVPRPTTRMLVHGEPPPLPMDLIRLLQRLRLRYARLAGPELLVRARQEGWDHVRLPSGKTFEAWDPAASAIPADAQWALRSLDWLGRAENLVLVGPSGTGRSHVAEAICHAAIDVDLRVSWFTLESLTATIARSKVDATTAKVVARICYAELIVVDDIGLLPAGEDEAEALYRLVDAAYEKRSLILTSNLHPGRFDTIFPKGLATAAVDSVLHHAHVVVTEGQSKRLSDALAGRGVRPLPAANGSMPSR